MFFKQFYLNCLAQASYMIGSDGVAAVIDPQRDVDVYLEEARLERLKIRYVIETHLHADFVSGHRDLAEATGAQIYYGASAAPAFDHVPVRDGDTLEFGDVRLRFMETPGHTPESICIAVIDKTKGDQPEAVLTGDTLFIGDVGRPDLLGSRMTAPELAGLLYDSLHTKLLTLPDSVKVYPGHGAGSLCGRSLSKETVSTIGQQRQFNYALQPMSKEAFVRVVTTDLPEAPRYFSMDARMNLQGPELLSRLPELLPLSPSEVADKIEEGVLILDTRTSLEYGEGHVPNSVHIGLTGQYASWAGSLLDPKTPIILVAESDAKIKEARIRLARVGLENVLGFLDGGFASWDLYDRPMKRTTQITVDELRDHLRSKRPGLLVDVRRRPEWEASHIEGAMNVPLSQLESEVQSWDRQLPITVICASGFRSSIATSILERLGFETLTNVTGGMNAWSSTETVNA